MGFRFRKSIKLMPGVRVNISKSGPSVSIGGRGATVNIGRKGTRTTVGLPGTGLSYSEYTPYGRSGARPSSDTGEAGRAMGIPTTSTPSSSTLAWILFAAWTPLCWLVGTSFGVWVIGAAVNRYRRDSHARPIWGWRRQRGHVVYAAPEQFAVRSLQAAVHVGKRRGATSRVPAVSPR